MGGTFLQVNAFQDVIFLKSEKNLTFHHQKHYLHYIYWSAWKYAASCTFKKTIPYHLKLTDTLEGEGRKWEKIKGLFNNNRGGYFSCWYGRGHWNSQGSSNLSKKVHGFIWKSHFLCTASWNLAFQYFRCCWELKASWKTVHYAEFKSSTSCQRCAIKDLFEMEGTWQWKMKRK